MAKKKPEKVKRKPLTLEDALKNKAKRMEETHKYFRNIKTLSVIEPFRKIL
ncbi:TPA: hypothetical protein ACN7KQ_003136 [Klebsiella pneumoniae]